MKPLRLLQFNIQYGQNWNESSPDHAPCDLESTIETIRRLSPDVIHLQEVEQVGVGGVHPEPPPNYTRLRAALSGYDSCFSYPRPDPRELPFGIGLAIFSRTRLHDCFREDLPSPPVEFVFDNQTTTPTDRLLIGATTKIGGHTLSLLNTHLLAFFMLNTTSIEHPEQRQRIATHLQGARGPTLLSGDFNVRNHESLRAQFKREGFTTVQYEKPTWKRQPYVLDHIFYNNELRCVSHEVITTPASDHHAIVADFEFV
ncbi:endonuclease [Opitutaceae bacterium TAV4]|uniref:endonuclease/exonuclease/phosphatase family protein n=1 Tax=Geminisphaera colitermitum TaxID=1148786 RepID=UPI0005BCDB38|nr:endonuclease/exonuclease/phosphatase family protein [Geminisphaera colitermitum]RRJ95880.1 endonuclease [Opitutaceae bacterium TAV4]